MHSLFAWALGRLHKHGLATWGMLVKDCPKARSWLPSVLLPPVQQRGSLHSCCTDDQQCAHHHTGAQSCRLAAAPVELTTPAQVGGRLPPPTHMWPLPGVSTRVWVAMSGGRVVQLIGRLPYRLHPTLR